MNFPVEVTRGKLGIDRWAELSCERRDHSSDLSFFRTVIGTWQAAGTDSGVDFNSGMRRMMNVNPKRQKYKIVTVHQPPFMYYNEYSSILIYSVFNMYSYLFLLTRR